MVADTALIIYSSILGVYNSSIYYILICSKLTFHFIIVAALIRVSQLVGIILFTNCVWMEPWINLPNALAGNFSIGLAHPLLCRYCNLSLPSGKILIIS